MSVAPVSSEPYNLKPKSQTLTPLSPKSSRMREASPLHYPIKLAVKAGGGYYKVVRLGLSVKDSGLVSSLNPKPSGSFEVTRLLY